MEPSDEFVIFSTTNVECQSNKTLFLNISQRFDQDPKQLLTMLFFSFDPCLRNFWCSTNFFGLAQDRQGRGYFKKQTIEKGCLKLALRLL